MLYNGCNFITVVTQIIFITDNSFIYKQNILLQIDVGIILISFGLLVNGLKPVIY